MGPPVVKTQHLDALAAYGVRFEDFYTASPVCMPNRTSFMASRYPRVNGLHYNGCVLPASANIFVDVLAADGYKTAALEDLGLADDPNEMNKLWDNPAHVATRAAFAEQMTHHLIHQMDKNLRSTRRA